MELRMNLRFLFTSGAVLLAAVAVARAAPAPGKVYLVVGSDTAVWNVAGGVDVSQYHGHFLPDLYIFPQENGYKVMDPAFRNGLLDSYGQPIKLTWWMLVGSVYGLADNTDVPMPNLMPLYLMQKYHGDAMQQFGDEVSLHYHTFFWSDYDGDGKYYWNQARTFHECRADFDLALAQSLLEGNVFPVSFRSGWHYMDNEWQAYLNLLLPFSLHNDSPNVHTDTLEPYDNVYDWSKATLNFIPFHPSTTNYQFAGDGIGWNVRSVKMPSMTQAMMNQMFAQAAAGTDQVACLWAHLPEIDFLTNTIRIDSLAHAAAGSYPTVQFRYCTAVEAMQRWLGTTDQTPPQLDVAEDVQGETVTLSINTSEAIFQPQPFVAIKDLCEQYQILQCSPVGVNSWQVTLPVPHSYVAKIGVAVTDLAGNLTTRIIRYLPDDIYLDNLDPQYAEPSGTWTATTNAAWGVDARVALLGANDTARARWSLPISNSGPYKIFVQIPPINNAAGNVSYNVYSGGASVLSNFFSASLPGKQWIYLGTPFLDQSLGNTLEMTVSGANQPNTFAVADVVKLSPLTPQPGFIDHIQVEPSVTTANLTWTTLIPATTQVEYGQDLGYGSFSASNSLPVTNHVMTLSGLTPGTTYYFQIDSVAGGTLYTARYCFTTASSATNFVSTLAFNVNNVWKYSTNNLDRTNWQAAAYNDASWPGGPGLLWADTRPADTDSPVQPKGTRMPINPSTSQPFTTYYFRTHFSFNGSTSGLSMMFSNYIDDGAVFYLNGAEIYRQNMLAAPAVITNASLASAFNCGGDATCSVLFAVSGKLLTNLVSGDNVLAVEVHNYMAGSRDITFGSALVFSRPITLLPKLHVLRSGEILTLYWNETGFTLQEASQLDASGTNWTDLAGPVTASPYAITNVLANRFYRIRGP